MFSGPSLGLRDAIRQLGLARRGFGEADYAPAEHAVILKKVQSKEFGSFSLLEYQIDSYEELGLRLGSGDIIILLADETYRNQPSEDLLLGVFHNFDIPVGDYLDMIASFFLVQPPRATPKYLRPTAYPESAADLRFPNCSYNVPVSGVESHSSNLPELCYKFYVVDASPTATRTRIFSYSDSRRAVTPVLVDVPKIHKCVVLIKPVSDYVILTTTHRGLSGRFLNFRYPLGGFFGKAVTVSAAQYVLAESGSLGWDICLDSIESGMEGLLQEAFTHLQGNKDANGRREMWDGVWEDLAILQRCRSDVLELMRANLGILSSIEDISSMDNSTPQNQLPGTLKHFQNRLVWQMNRAVTLEKTINIGMNRVARRCQTEQESTNQWISMSSLKILFIFRTFSKAVAYILILFLPAIFVSTLFSTWFWSPDGLSGVHQLWIYFVIVIPLTTLIMLITGLWYGFSSGTRLWPLNDSTHKARPAPVRRSVEDLVNRRHVQDSV